MYIQHIYDKNIGPLADVDIHMPFDKDGNPKPIILVGENGSGKSTFLSNIVDSFYELARGECKILCVKSNCTNLFYAPYWGK
jgi:ABC-type Mn2+/Zn2+ transport system ATPase subunit